MIQATHVITGTLNGRTMYLHQPDAPDGLFFATDSLVQAKKIGDKPKAEMIAERENNTMATNVPTAKIWRGIEWKVKRLFRDTTTGELFW